MNIIYNFKEIKEYYTKYKIQAQIYHIQESINYTSIILMDFNKQKIELIAFKQDINKLKQFQLQINKYYLITDVKTMANNRFKRTNHRFKLKIDSKLTNVKLLKTFKIIKNNKICVKQIKKKPTNNNNNNNNVKQLSIMNFLNVKK